MFDLPVKNREETYEKISRSMIIQLVIYWIMSTFHILIATDLSKQIELEDSNLKQQIKFIGNLEGQDKLKNQK